MKLSLILASLISLTIYSHQHEASGPFSLFKSERDLIVEISYLSKDHLIKQLNQSGYDIAGIDHQNKIIDLVVNQEEYFHLKEMGLSPEIIMTKFLLSTPDSEYKTPEEIEKILYQFQREFPLLAKVHVLGQSVEARNIYAIQLTEHKQRKKPALLFNGMHHAREVMGPEVNLDIIEYLLSNYQNNSQVKKWMQNLDIWVLPMLNVDGNNRVWNKNAMWRKNTKNNYGVDIARNYPFKWDGCGGSSGWRRSGTYRGESPSSEPETRALMNLVKKIRPVFDISYHAYSQLVIYPYGCKGERAKNLSVVEGIGKELGRLLKYKPGTAWETLYSVDGSDIDWMYHEYNVIPYVVELNSRKEGFQPKYKKWRDKTVKKNRVAWQFLLQRMFESGLKGTITVNQKRLPVNTIVSILQAQNHKESFVKIDEYKLRSESDFYLILNPGKYKLQINYLGKKLISPTLLVKDEMKEFNIQLFSQ